MTTIEKAACAEAADYRTLQETISIAKRLKERGKLDKMGYYALLGIISELTLAIEEENQPIEPF